MRYKNHDCGVIKTFGNHDKRDMAILADLKRYYYMVNKVISETKDVFLFIIDHNDSGDMKNNLSVLANKYNHSSIIFIPKDDMDDEYISSLFEGCIFTSEIFGSGTNAIMADRFSKEFDK